MTRFRIPQLIDSYIEGLRRGSPVVAKRSVIRSLRGKLDNPRRTIYGYITYGFQDYQIREGDAGFLVVQDGSGIRQKSWTIKTSNYEISYDNESDFNEDWEMIKS